MAQRKKAPSGKKSARRASSGGSQQQSQSALQPPSLAPDPLVQELVSDPGAVPQLSLLAGLFGKSDTEGRWRVYTSPDLSVYVEFDESALRHREQSPSPLGGSFVWVNASAGLTTHYVGRRGAQHEFLGGPGASHGGLDEPRRTWFCAVWVTCPVDAEEPPAPRTWYCAPPEEAGARHQGRKRPDRVQPGGAEQDQEERTPLCPPPDPFA